MNGFPQYNELPAILVRERTRPLYDAITQRANRIRDMERELKEAYAALERCRDNAHDALTRFENQTLVRDKLRDIQTNARRALK